MLSYLHGYHAGNAADVLKHSVLLFCLTYLKKKDKPLLCVDTHAGSGLYDLGETSAQPNREWGSGIGRLLNHSAALPEMLSLYLQHAAPETAAPLAYSGSPTIMATKLTKGDRLVCFELHPKEAAALDAVMQKIRKERDISIEVRKEDGLGGLTSLLPPPSRRALILVDPSWEEVSEYKTVPRHIHDALKRFPEGTYIVWYPLLAVSKGAHPFSKPIQDTLFTLDAYHGNNRDRLKRCRVELYTRQPDQYPPLTEGATEKGKSPRNMYGSGLVIYNPPWTLEPSLNEALPYLAKTLGASSDAWRLDWSGE